MTPTPTHNGFAAIKHVVAEQFRRMVGHDLFRTTVGGDALWAAYLAAFPAGTDPIFRERTEHDCSCCRGFVRAVGNVVAVVDGRLVSVWDGECDHPTYSAVAGALSALVKSHPIANPFLHTEGRAGTDRSFEDGAGGVKTWEHFCVDVPNSRVCRDVDIGPRLAESRALHDVLLRGLSEITADAVDAVLELVAQNSLYRGEEHKFAVSAFRQAKEEFDRMSPERRDAFVWAKSGELPAAVAKIRHRDEIVILTYRYRLKDNSAKKALRRYAFACNQG